MLPTTLDNFLVVFLGVFASLHSHSLVWLLTSLQNLKNLSLSREHTKRTKLLPCLSLSIASSSHFILLPKQSLNQSLTDQPSLFNPSFQPLSESIHQLGFDRRFTGMLLLFQFVSCVPPHSLSLSNSSLFALFFSMRYFAT